MNKSIVFLFMCFFLSTLGSHAQWSQDTLPWFKAPISYGDLAISKELNFTRGKIRELTRHYGIRDFVAGISKVSGHNVRGLKTFMGTNCPMVVFSQKPSTCFLVQESIRTLKDSVRPPKMLRVLASDKDKIGVIIQASGKPSYYLYDLKKAEFTQL